MRVRAAASLLVTGFALAACAQKPVPVALPPAEPDPYGYLKVSAVCSTGPVTQTPDGTQSATMQVRSDDGLCALPVSQKTGGAYASFLLTELPQHGKAFIHNYNGQTLVDYTATTAYAGPDSFTVSLVPENGARTSLRVVASVDNTGVPVPVAAPVVAAVPGSTGHATTGRRSTTSRHTNATKKTSHASSSNSSGN